MINLLPEQIKKDIRYSRYNTISIRYVILVAIVAVCLSLIMVSGTFFAQREINSLQEELDSKEALVGELRATEQEAKQFKEELDTVDKLFEQQSNFSVFLEELASVIPPWARLESLQLTRPDPPKRTVTIDEDGNPVVEETKPTNDGKSLDITFVVREAADAAVLRKNLLELPRIEFVDIQSVNSDSNEESAQNTKVVMRLALRESPDKIYTPPEEAQP